MSAAQSAADVLGREYLTARAKLIDLAAFLDRLDRAHSDRAHSDRAHSDRAHSDRADSDRAGSDDPRLGDIRRGLEILAGNAADRTEKIQLLFSLPYRQSWQKDYGL